MLRNPRGWGSFVLSSVVVLAGAAVALPWKVSTTPTPDAPHSSLGMYLVMTQQQASHPASV
jgi:hypothetical protein